MYFIFRHTFEEISELLRNASIWLDSDNRIMYKPEMASITTRYLVNNNYSKLKLDTEIEKLEETIIYELKVSIIEKPNIVDEKSEYLIGETDLTNIIEGLYKNRNCNFDADMYQRRTKRDVDSIMSIYIFA